MRGIATVIAAVLALYAFAGCGGDDEAPAPNPPAGAREFKGALAKAFATGRSVCGAQPKSEFVEETGEVPAGSSDVVVARAYASEWPKAKRRAIFAGCLKGLSSVPDRPPPSAPEGKALWNQDFRGVSVTAQPGAKDPPIKRAEEIELGFSNERDHSLYWSGLCNNNGGRVDITATHLELRNAGGTLMGCPDGREEEDAWLFNFFDAGPEWRLEGDALTLSTDAAVFELERANS